MFSLEFWFVADAKLTYQVVIIKDGTIYFPPVNIKFRKQTARGMEVDWKGTSRGMEVDWKRTGSGLEVDINILIYEFSGIQQVLGSYSQGPCSNLVLKVVGDSLLVDVFIRS